ncbi:MAG: sugar transferase [Flavobacteriaceae bacterium]|nr:sugar transferase [Bacteroidia bacterium]NNL61458.1 sugar transferase [Flavobacteriaceae bacterium]
MYRIFLKRAIDFLGSLFGLILLSPIFVVIVLVLIFLNDGKPFFTQLRPGKNEKLFCVIKFKTMTDKKDSSGNLLPDNVRLTQFGRFLRKTSLDEIPQLINVLKGDMSIVGPRPLLVEFLEYYTEEELARHDVRPGITGLAQISGRNFLSDDEKFRIDVDYVNRLSFWLDVRILLKTIQKVFKSEDIVLAPDVDPGINEVREKRPI